MQNLYHLLALITLAAPALGASPPWSVDELRARFWVRGETFVLDGSGKRVIRRRGEWRDWRNQFKNGKIDNHWSSTSEGERPIAFHHKWELQPDGTIHVVIEQYGKVIEHGSDEGPEFKDLIKKKEMVLENVEPITWVAWKDAEQTIVVRFTPDFDDSPEPQKLVDFPISGTDMMLTDSKGTVWADHVTDTAKYCGYVTHRGAVFLSFLPFAGAVELGEAKDNEIHLKVGNEQMLTLSSRTAFLPSGITARVYGIYQPSKRTSKLNRTHVMGSSTEAEFLRKIQSR